MSSNQLHYSEFRLSPIVFLFGLSALALPQMLAASAPVHNVSRRNAIVDVVEATAPAVVSISTEQVVKSSPFGSYHSLLGSFFQDIEPQKRLEKTSLGSGVIIDKEGHILTNEHVIRGAARVTATLADDREVECEVIGSDPDNDLAVLRMNEKVTVTPAQLGTSRDLMIGETVIAIGNPFGLSHTVTTGVVSARHRSFKVDDRVYRNFIQIDAAINPGNSGGPLINILGEVIGINSAIYGGAEGLGFAIPIDKAKKVVEDLILYGERLPGWLGLEVEEGAYEANPQAGRKGPAVVVTWVEAGGPADKAGLEVGDRLVSIDQAKVEGVEDYQSALRQLGTGDELHVGVVRANVDGPFELKIKSVQFPTEIIDRLISERLGIKVVPLTEALARQYRLATAKGLLITEVRQTGLIAKVGGKPGDVIRKVNGIVTRQPDDLKSALIRAWARKNIVCLIQRGRVVYTVPIPL